MRENDRDLIRGGHYGQRSCEPRKQAEHMAAPTNPANVKKVLANTEPFSNRASVVNRLFFAFTLLPGVTVLSAVGLAAATCGPKHRRCNVHNGLA
jgi:hypothetical protein